MSRMSHREIDQAYQDDWTEQDVDHQQQDQQKDQEDE